MNKTNKDLNKDLIEWIRLALGDPAFSIIVADQRGTEPTGAFATILAINSASVGMAASYHEFVDGLGGPDGAIGLATSSLREVDYSLQFYRDGAHENMRKIMRYPSANTSREFLFQKGISIFIPQSYNNLDDIAEDGVINRSQMDIRLHCASEYVETVNAIDDAPLSILS